MNPIDYLATILRGILPNPESLQLEEEIAGHVTVLTIDLPQDDRRFVVGKRGRNIEALRQLLRAYAGLHGRSIVVKLPDEDFISKERNEYSKLQTER